MNDPKLNPLLNELLCGDEAEPCRAASLNQMLASARRRQRQRRTRRTAVLAALPALLGLAWFASHRPAPETGLVAPVHPSSRAATTHVAQAAATSSETAPVRFISDDELLSLFPGRAVALIGTPGHQTLVLWGPRPRPGS